MIQIQWTRSKAIIRFESFILTNIARHALQWQLVYFVKQEEEENQHNFLEEE